MTTKHTPEWTYYPAYGHIVDLNQPCGSGSRETDQFYGGVVICETVNSKYADLLLAAPAQQAEINRLKKGIENAGRQFDEVAAHNETLAAEINRLKAQVERLRGLCRESVKDLSAWRAWEVRVEEYEGEDTEQLIIKLNNALAETEPKREETIREIEHDKSKSM